LALLGDRLNLGLTYYRQKTEDAIVEIELDPSSGFQGVMANGASWRNWGWEATLDLLAARSRAFAWRLSAQWASNRSMVDTLLGQETVSLHTFAGYGTGVVKGHPFPVLLGGDFVRFGRGTRVGDVYIDSVYSGWQPGDLYVCAPPDPGCAPSGGFPLADLGDPNPDWLGSLRTTFTFFDKVRLSALIDVKHGGDMWNGTKGSLYYFGTGKEMERFHGPGVDTVFAGVGPGAGTEVTLNWQTWFVGGAASMFSGNFGPYVEEAGYVKLRDVSLSYTWEASWLSRIGFSALDITAWGRNLVTIPSPISPGRALAGVGSIRTIPRRVRWASR
jgi:hypothetical protein